MERKRQTRRFTGKDSCNPIGPCFLLSYVQSAQNDNFPQMVTTSNNGELKMHDWIDDVLLDIKTYAEMNGLNKLASDLAQVLEGRLDMTFAALARREEFDLGSKIVAFPGADE